MEKSNLNKDSYSYSELNEIRAESADNIKEIRQEILCQNINNIDNEVEDQNLRILKLLFGDDIVLDKECDIVTNDNK